MAIAKAWRRNRIKRHRQFFGDTQARFARRVNLSLSKFGQIERGERAPTDHQATKIARSLGVRVVALQRQGAA